MDLAHGLSEMCLLIFISCWDRCRHCDDKFWSCLCRELLFRTRSGNFICDFQWRRQVNMLPCTGLVTEQKADYEVIELFSQYL